MSLTTTITISSLCLVAARNRVLSSLDLMRWLLSTKIRVNLKIGTKNTRSGVPREQEGGMKTTLYRDNTTLRWTLFEDRVAPRHQWQLPDGVARCVCMLQLARTTTDGLSYMASCSTAAISSRVCGRWNRMTVMPTASFQRSLATCCCMVIPSLTPLPIS